MHVNFMPEESKCPVPNPRLHDLQACALCVRYIIELVDPKYVTQAAHVEGLQVIDICLKQGLCLRAV